VPDWVVRKADLIELIGSSPEQLRRRMLHGNIYPMEKVPQALTHFFRTDNLIALRELALRFVAYESDEELLEHLRRHQPQGSCGKPASASWRPSPPRQGTTC
jgi:two-component system, OmpR family, sensor histidine kinase KdpD